MDARIQTTKEDELRGPSEPEPASETPPLEGSSNDAGDMRHVAGKVAVAAMLASTLSAVPPSATDFPLPEATPIVHVLSADHPDTVPDSLADDECQDDAESVWKKVLKILKYLLILLALVAVAAFAALKGCASCSGTVAAPVEQSSSSASASASA